MKYFSIETWQDSPHPDDAGNRYRRYISSVRQQLPAAVQMLYSGGGHIAITDVRLTELALDIPGGCLRLGFEGAEVKDQSLGWKIVSYRPTLTYVGVLSFTSASEPGHGLPGPIGYGEMGFDEFELLDNGIFQHRLLFSSGIEIAVTFSDIVVELADL